MKTRSEVAILADLDDTCVNLLPSWLEAYFVHNQSDQIVSMKDIKNYQLESEFVEPEVLWQALPEALRKAEPKQSVLSVLKNHVKEFPGSISLVTTVAEKCNPAEIVAAKNDWFLRHCPEFVGYEITASPQQRANEPADILIDDHPANIEAWLEAKPDRTAIMIKMPWNSKQHIKPSLHHRLSVFGENGSEFFEDYLDWAIEMFLELANSSKAPAPKYLGADELLVTKRDAVKEDGTERVVEEQQETGATKHDNGKPQLSLIPVEALNEMARGFMYGAKKYGTRNYELGMQHSRLLDASLRHLFAVSTGEFIDAESGNTHLSHALCSIAMLCFNRANHPEMDDITRSRGKK